MCLISKQKKKKKSEYYKLYDALSTQEVCIFNKTHDKLNIQCGLGKERGQKCHCQPVGCLSIPIGDPDRFIILKSPVTFCSTHRQRSSLYGYVNEQSKLYLGIVFFSLFLQIYVCISLLLTLFLYISGEGDQLLNALRWYTLIAFKPNQTKEDVMKHFPRRYHVTERFLSNVVKSIIVDGTSIPRFLKTIASQYASFARDNWLNVHPQSQLDVNAINEECSKFFQAETFSAALKEFVLGYISDKNDLVENAIYKTIQTDFYADAAHSTIKHTMKPNTC